MRLDGRPELGKLSAVEQGRVSTGKGSRRRAEQSECRKGRPGRRSIERNRVSAGKGSRRRAGQGECREGQAGPEDVERSSRKAG
jgi:hypothetical protein